MPVNGLVARVPTSVDVENGTASIATNGTVTVSTAGAYANLNGVFSADYRNYMIVMRLKTPVSAADLFARLSASGSPATTSDYNYQELTVGSGTYTGVRTTSAAYWNIGNVQATEPGSITMFIAAPYLADETVYRSTNGTQNPAGCDYSGFHNVVSSYDGIRIMGPTLSVDFTGTITVYGFKE